MKLSEKLRAAVSGLWEEAADKPFVTGMALGDLPAERFRIYMLQDYLYLQDYIEILKKMRSLAGSEGTPVSGQPGNSELQAFLDGVIEETTQETFRVHLPNMKRIGIGEEEIADCKALPVITGYVDYMQKQVDQGGLIAGLAALLQCSWVYAYIGEAVSAKYAKEIAASPYKSWFASYACAEYTEANRRWIGALDAEAEGISEEEAERLCGIFRRCAEYENRFWDALYEAYI